MEKILDFVKENYVYVIIAASVLFLLLITLFVVLVRKHGKRKQARKDQATFAALIDALGGRENIEGATARGSRLTIVLTDYTIIDEPKLKELGVGTIIRMTTKLILVIGSQSQEFCTYIANS